MRDVQRGNSCCEIYSSDNLDVHAGLDLRCSYMPRRFFFYVRYNLNGSNTDESFTVDDSNSFFSPNKILSIAQEKYYLGIFSYFIMELYGVCSH